MLYSKKNFYFENSVTWTKQRSWNVKSSHSKTHSVCVGWCARTHARTHKKGRAEVVKDRITTYSSGVVCMDRLRALCQRTCSPVWSEARWWSPRRRRWSQSADWWPTDRSRRTWPRRGGTARRSFHWNTSSSAAEARGHRVSVCVCVCVSLCFDRSYLTP